MRKRQRQPKIRPRALTLDDLRAEYEAALDELAQVDLAPFAAAVEEADWLDVDVRLGQIEPGAAEAVQTEARQALAAETERRERLTAVAEGLRLRALAVVDGDQDRLRESVWQELARIDDQISELDQRRRLAERERAAVEARYAEAWEAIEESRRSFDSAAAAAHAQAESAQRAMVLSAIRGGTVGLLPEHLQARAEQERQRLARETQESLARSLERNRAEAAALGITLDAGA